MPEEVWDVYPLAIYLAPGCRSDCFIFYPSRPYHLNGLAHSSVLMQPHSVTVIQVQSCIDKATLNSYGTLLRYTRSGHIASKLVFYVFWVCGKSLKPLGVTMRPVT